MGRLVDIDAVIKVVDKHTKDESEIVLDNDITCILEEVPTAYDVEKILAKLEVLKNEYCDLETKNIQPYKHYFIRQGVENAIDIVKAGGVIW